MPKEAFETELTRNLPRIPADKDDDLRDLATKVNGFVYHGDALEAVIRTIRVLRADPDLAARLLGPKPNLGNGAPLSVFPVQSDHKDVHTLQVCRANGDSVTVTELRRVFQAVTGRELVDDEIPFGWFAEEDRI